MENLANLQAQKLMEFYQDRQKIEEKANEVVKFLKEKGVSHDEVLRLFVVMSGEVVIKLANSDAELIGLSEILKTNLMASKVIKQADDLSQEAVKGLDSKGSYQ